MTSSPNHSMKPYSQAWYDYQKTALGEAACRQLGFFVIPDEFLLSVVIPVFNEETTLGEIVRRVAEVPIRKEIILVDDASTDSSPMIALELLETFSHDPNNELSLLSSSTNSGKGASIRKGLLKSQGDVVVIQDADLEYDPKDFPKLIQPIVEQKADVVYGSRFLGDGPRPAGYLWSYLGNQFITSLSNLFTGLNLSDMETCYKVFSREALDRIKSTLVSDRFAIEPEVTAKIARNGYRVFEVPINYSGRTFDEGKKIRPRDAFEAVWAVIRFGLFKS